mmetsp:Transcript_33846/g.81413  ORF Transcript_33846/g.81413 Transcript_33846/m.81413 type:complete len:356 (-) Transcript_33846:92-1159(-)
MPELPEVEKFRRLLETLVSDKDSLKLERHSLDKNPPRKFLSDADIGTINDGDYIVTEARRKGKQICLNIQPKKNKKAKNQPRYLMVHMGMTGSISTPTSSLRLQEVKYSTDFPPPYTYLQFTAGSIQACFADPRKFGSILLKDSDEEFNDLAPDAWTDLDIPDISNDFVDDEEQYNVEECISCPTTISVVQKLAGKSTGIKALLLDQKRAVCGVGNWVADEVLYQCRMHPDQNYLTELQCHNLLFKLHGILEEAVSCLHKGEEFPSEWLFHYRWSNKGKGTTSQDFNGKTITFVTSGGRTSAVVPSLQKKKAGTSRKAATPTTTSKAGKGKRKTVSDDDDREGTGKKTGKKTKKL